MQRDTTFFLIVGLMGLAALSAFDVIGSTIDADGVLREPFFLLPIGFSLTFIGFGGVMFLTIWRKLRPN